MTKQDNIALKVDHVAKMFRLPTEQASGIKQAVINWTKGIKGYKEQHVCVTYRLKLKKAISSVLSGVMAAVNPRC